MIIPPFLNKGDLIGLAAPAGMVSVETVHNAHKLLEHYGFRVKTGAHALKGHYRFSAPDNERARDFQDLLDDTEVKAIWCLRGGYGCSRIIHLLDFKTLKAYPKWIIGFSDISILHYAAHNENICSLHAQMPLNFPADNQIIPANIKETIDLICGNFHKTQWKTNPHNKSGNTNGILIGGNLSVLCGLRGSPYDVDYREKILFLEDRGEEFYKLDRLFHMLYHGNVFEKICGLILGDFGITKDGEDDFGKTFEDNLNDILAGYDFPVYYDFPSGHIPNNYPILFGAHYEINTDNDNCTLSIKNG